MSDYPMLISNKLHSFRNFEGQIYEKAGDIRRTRSKRMSEPPPIFHTTYILPSLHPGNSPHADPVGKFHCKQKGSGQGVAD